MAGGAPAEGGGVGGWVVGEGLEDEVAGVAAAGGSYLPVVGGGAAGEVGGLEAEGGGVEDGFEGAELVEDGEESGVGGEEGFARAMGSIVGRRRIGAGLLGVGPGRGSSAVVGVAWWGMYERVTRVWGNLRW